MPSPAAEAPAYDPGDVYDEAFEGPGVLRRPYRDLFASLAGADLGRLCAAVADGLHRRRVVFGGEEGRRFHVDPVPRLLTLAEFAALERGLAQRVRALEAFLGDVYGERRIFAEGVVPDRLLDGLHFLEDDLSGVVPAGGARIGIAGLDVVRDHEGRFLVLEDNLRTPSGMAYALAACEAVGEALPVERPGRDVPGQIHAALRRVMEASAPDVEGELVLLSDGMSNSAWFEHRRLARLAGLELVGVGDLRRKGRRLVLADRRPVRAVYRRTDEDRLRDERGVMTEVGELLLEPLRHGAVGLVNWFGNGVADDKRVYPYVDAMVRFYLGEEPQVRSVPTYDLVDAPARREALDRLGELVVKPRDGHGGRGVLVGPGATRAQLDEAARAIADDPAAWVAQETIALSSHPTVVDGRLAPRRVDLRPFVFNDGAGTTVLRGGLTRVALREGSLVVNSSQAGGGKDTWLVD
jgi:uncharacterized circularly permuted ATP-grasp superfamily protein